MKVMGKTICVLALAMILVSMTPTIVAVKIKTIALPLENENFRIENAHFDPPQFNPRENETTTLIGRLTKNAAVLTITIENVRYVRFENVPAG